MATRGRPKKRRLFAPGVPYVEQDNNISRAPIKAKSVYVQRFLTMVAAQVRQGDPPETDYAVDIRDLLSKSVQYVDGKAFAEAKKNAKIMLRTLIEFQKHDGSDVICPLVTKAEFTKDKGTVIFNIHTLLQPMYTQLRKGFNTYYARDEFLQLNYKYSQDLFRLITSWRGVPSFRKTIDDIHKFLNTPPSYRRSYAIFREKVLNPALADIREHTSLQVEVIEIRNGVGKTAKIDALEFILNKSLRDEIIHARENEAQRQSWSCYKSVQNGEQSCNFRNNAICRYCRERGGMYLMKMAADESRERGVIDAEIVEPQNPLERAIAESEAKSDE